VFALAGLSVSPAVAAILMSISTIAVAANARRLRRLDLDPARLGRPRPSARVGEGGWFSTDMYVSTADGPAGVDHLEAPQVALQTIRVE
jgi:hypothetical protein